jgi:hypothetical protein
MNVTDSVQVVLYEVELERTGAESRMAEAEGVVTWINTQ